MTIETKGPYSPVGPDFKRLTLADAPPDAGENEARVKQFLADGHFVAVYINQDLGHPDLGLRKYWAGGNGFTVPTPEQMPRCLPDTPTTINWRYWLEGVILPEAPAVKDSTLDRMEAEATPEQ